jgi:hypothetical protein
MDHALLTSEQIRTFAERGYLVVPGLASPDDLDRADAEVARLAAEEPPPADHTGHYHYWLSPAESPVLFGLLENPGRILQAARQLTGEDVAVAFGKVQLALNIPPFLHKPGGPHIDGYSPGQATPGTFTLLAGLLLTDQLHDNGGNLWVWPGTHLAHAAFFAERGPEAFEEAAGYPDIDWPEPVQIHGRRGDVLLAHYLLGHNIGGNYEGGHTRQALYWRLRAPGHSGRWASCLASPWLEFEPVRRTLKAVATAEGLPSR